MDEIRSEIRYEDLLKGMKALIVIKMPKYFRFRVFWAKVFIFMAYALLGFGSFVFIEKEIPVSDDKEISD